MDELLRHPLGVAMPILQAQATDSIRLYFRLQEIRRDQNKGVTMSHGIQIVNGNLCDGTIFRIR